MCVSDCMCVKDGVFDICPDGPRGTLSPRPWMGGVLSLTLMKINEETKERETLMLVLKIRKSNKER